MLARVLVAVVLLLSVVVPSASAETTAPNYHYIEGYTFFDPINPGPLYGTPPIMTGWPVKICNDTTHECQETVSDSTGWCHFIQMPYGWHTVEVEIKNGVIFQYPVLLSPTNRYLVTISVSGHQRYLPGLTKNATEGAIVCEYCLPSYPGPFETGLK